MTIRVNGVEIEIQGAATVRMDGDKVIIEMDEREPVQFVPHEGHGIDQTVPYHHGIPWFLIQPAHRPVPQYPWLNTSTAGSVTIDYGPR